MENILITELLSHTNWLYLASVILLTYLILLYVITKPNKFVKILIHLGSGICLGILLYFIEKVSILDLVFSFLLSITFYSWVLKALCTKFNLKYDNGIGITDTKSE